MSWQAELLHWSLAMLKPRQSKRPMPPAQVRRRLKLIERIVPRPPAGTQTAAFDAGGVPSVRIAVPEARKGRCVLYLHGGGYGVGSAALYRDFTWRIGRAARASVLFVDYRLAPEHPFPAALDDAVNAYRWLADQFDPRRMAFVGDSAGEEAAWPSRRCSNYGTRATRSLRLPLRSPPGRTWRSPAPRCTQMRRWIRFWKHQG